MNLRVCVWEIQYRIIRRTTLQEKERIHYSTTVWFTSLLVCLKLWKFRQQKHRWTRNGKIGENSAWNLTKVKSNKDVIDEANTSGATVHFVSFMDIRHLKSAELEAKHQKYKWWSCAPRWFVKDGSGSYAVFTEQGSSASQMTASKIMDIIFRLPGCDGQAADALSAYTQVKMEDAHKLLKIPKSWSSMEDPVVLLERNLYGHSLAGLMGKAIWEKFLLKHGWENIPNWDCLFVHREKGWFFSVYVDVIKIDWKETKSWSDVETTQQRSWFWR